MKRIILIIMLFSGVAFAQNITDYNNTTTTALDSAAAYTGTATRLVDYGGERGQTSAISVSVYSDQNSGTNGFKVQFSHDGSLWVTSHQSTITGASGVPTKVWFYPEDSYYRVTYTNSTTDQDTLYITSKLFHGAIYPNDDALTDSLSAGNAQLNLIKTNGDTTNAVLNVMEPDIDLIADSTTIQGNLFRRIATSNDSIEVNIEESNVLLESATSFNHVKLAGVSVATQLADHPCKWVIIESLTSGEIGYVGGSALNANGLELQQHDSVYLIVTNTNLAYVDSDGSSIDFVYIYGN